MGNYAVTKSGLTLPEYLKADKVKKSIVDVTGKNPAAFISPILVAFNGNEQLQKCEPSSIFSAAVFAAGLNLSVDPSQGQAYLVPFKNKAQFQIGWRGYVQLALRTGQYKKIHAGVIRKGEIRSIDPLTGEFVIGEKISDEIVGYVAHLELVNGFSKTIYMSKAEMESHAQTYSQSYAADRKKTWSMWAKNFNQMAIKTILKKLLKNWGILSSEMQTAIQADQSVIDQDSFTYVDNDGRSVSREIIDVPSEENSESEPEFVNDETGEILFENTEEKTAENAEDVQAPF